MFFLDSNIKNEENDFRISLLVDETEKIFRMISIVHGHVYLNIKNFRY